jgi:hypothetical protein
MEGHGTCAPKAGSEEACELEVCKSTPPPGPTDPTGPTGVEKPPCTSDSYAPTRGKCTGKDAAGKAVECGGNSVAGGGTLEVTYSTKTGFEHCPAKAPTSEACRVNDCVTAGDFGAKDAPQECALADLYAAADDTRYWSECSVGCGGGTKALMAQKVLSDPKYARCNNVLVKTRSCNTHDCEYWVHRTGRVPLPGKADTYSYACTYVTDFKTIPSIDPDLKRRYLAGDELAAMGASATKPEPRTCTEAEKAGAWAELPDCVKFWVHSPSYSKTCPPGYKNAGYADPNTGEYTCNKKDWRTASSETPKAGLKYPIYSDGDATVKKAWRAC